MILSPGQGRQIRAGLHECAAPLGLAQTGWKHCPPVASLGGSQVNNLGCTCGDSLATPVHRAEDGLDRGEFDIRIHAGAPAALAGGELDLDVREGAGLGPGAERVLAEIGHLELRDAGMLRQGVDERGDRAVALARRFSIPVRH